MSELTGTKLERSVCDTSKSFRAKVMVRGHSRIHARNVEDVLHNQRKHCKERACPRKSTVRTRAQHMSEPKFSGSSQQIYTFGGSFDQVDTLTLCTKKYKITMI